MARPIYLWLPSLAWCALTACGGSADGLFSDVLTAGAGGSHAGASSHAGSSSTSSSGNPGIAGTPASGGTANSGGSPGSAGQVGAGTSNGGAQTGGTSSGGRGGAHSGGTGGGRAGAGGSGASAGHAGALVGSAGTGGSDQELTCTELLTLASDQLDAARACNAAANSLQCTGTVTNPCGCEVPVLRSTSTETKLYLATLKQFKDKDCSQICSKIACSLVNDAQCQASGSSTAGTCVASHGPGP